MQIIWDGLTIQVCPNPVLSRVCEGEQNRLHSLPLPLAGQGWGEGKRGERDQAILQPAPESASAFAATPITLFSLFSTWRT